MVDDTVLPLKHQLAQFIVERLDGWSQIHAADLLGTDQPRISDLRNNRLDRFSLRTADSLCQSRRRIGRAQGPVERATLGSVRAIQTAVASPTSAKTSASVLPEDFGT